MSLPEVLLWRELRGRKDGRPVFRRQHPVGPFIVDFFCIQAKLAIEVDGGAHHADDRPDSDARRDAWLKGQGIRVVRVPAGWVFSSPHSIAERSRALAEAMIARRKSDRGA